MAENKLEGFEDFDNSAGGGAKAGGELDDLLGKGESGGAAGGGDSELDSFFEDLSTIDDLEVAQEAPKPAAAAPAAAAAPRQEAAEPAPKAPKAPKKPRAPAQPGRLRKILIYLALLAVFGGGGYYVYVTYVAGDQKIPWPTFPTKLPGLPKLPVADEPPARPEPRARPEPMVRPPKAPPRPTGPGFGIQVATCFFDSCVDSYKALLSEYPVRVKERMTQSETLEVYSQTAFANRYAAQEAAEKVNLDNRLEGHAYVIEEGNAFRLSMGAFQDLSRANVVKDTLNQRYGGQIVFAHRLKSVPYALKVVMAGTFPTRAEAEQALEKFRGMDRSLTGAFVVPNEK